MRHRMMKKGFQKGVTLFEVLLVLFVAAFIAAAVATIYNRVNTNYKQNSLFTAIQQLTGNIDGLFANESTGYIGLGDAGFIHNANLAPPVLMTADGKYVHPFSSKSDEAWLIDSVTATSYQIVINDIPKDVCPTFANNLKQIASAVDVGGEPITGAVSAVKACKDGDNVIEMTVGG